MRWTRILLLLLLPALNLPAQDHPPKREMRGVWVATVVNIDFPPKNLQRSKDQKQRWIDMLDSLQAMGLNALFVQVRPVSDAFYPSDLEPWSAYLSGKQGQAPRPYYDPLAFMLEEAHQRGFEFHAWLNPYRATFDMRLDLLAETHPLKQHPDWFVKYGKRYYYNPALPQVRTHINEVIRDLVTRYEIDGIHFDDYFYPYKIQGEVFPDSADFARFGQGFEQIDDWRRHNVDLLIEGLHHSIRAADPTVKFGVSPFGVWRNVALDPEKGSNTRAGQTTYDDLYADVLKWMQKGWIDYLVPQIYWHIGFDLADHQILSNWWNENSYGANIFIGHGAYRIGNHSAPEWNDPSEMPRQIRLNRSLHALYGSVFFSARSLFSNPLGFADSLSQAIYHYPALLPEYPQIEASPPPQVIIRKLKNRKGGIRIKWKTEGPSKGYYYVLYRYEADEKTCFDHASHIAQISPYRTQKLKMTDQPPQTNRTYKYVIRAVNEKHQEGPPSQEASVLYKK
jgi:uncharacterized lipoprotein YddW (UPF0748 family)